MQAGELGPDRKAEDEVLECEPKKASEPRHLWPSAATQPPSQSLVILSHPHSKKGLSLAINALFAWRLDLTTRNAIAFKSSYWNFINHGRLNITEKEISGHMSTPYSKEGWFTRSRAKEIERLNLHLMR